MNRKKTSALVAIVLPLTLLAACGDDDNDDAAPEATEVDTTESPAGTDAPDTTEATDGTDAPAGDTAAFCQSIVDVQSAVNALDGPEADPAAVATAIDAAEASAPADIADTAATFVAEGRAALEAGPSDAFFAAYGEVAAWMSGNCDYQVVDVTAVDYSFSGVPETLEAGPTVFNFANDGTEEHEFVFVRINDDVTMSIEELIALPEEEANSMITFGGATFAMPGTSAATVAELEPGRWAAVCFIPVGSTPEAVEDATENSTEIEGPPHAMSGMVVEFTVS